MNKMQEITACGWYKIEWFNSKGEIVKSERKYLTIPQYRNEWLKMQTAYLRGEDVAGMDVIPA